MKTLSRASLIFLALFIDGLQAGLSWGLATIGVAAGGALQLIPIVGTAAGVAAVPIGILLGFAVDFCLSATLGAGLVMLLAWQGMFYPNYLFGGTLFELIPGFDDLPGWTFMTIMCVLRKKKEEGSLVGTAATAFAGVLAPTSAVGAAAQAIRGVKQDTSRIAVAAGVTTGEQHADRIDSRQELKANLKNIDGIRPPSPSVVTPAHA